MKQHTDPAGGVSWACIVSLSGCKSCVLSVQTACSETQRICGNDSVNLTGDAGLNWIKGGTETAFKRRLFIPFTHLVLPLTYNTPLDFCGGSEQVRQARCLGAS